MLGAQVQSGFRRGSIWTPAIHRQLFSIFPDMLRHASLRRLMVGNSKGGSEIFSPSSNSTKIPYRPPAMQLHHIGVSVACKRSRTLTLFNAQADSVGR
jgi:hypothetical protein